MVVVSTVNNIQVPSLSRYIHIGFLATTYTALSFPIKTIRYVL